MRTYPCRRTHAGARILAWHTVSMGGSGCVAPSDATAIQCISVRSHGPPPRCSPTHSCPPAVSPVVRWNLAHPIRAFCPVSCSFCRSSAATGLGLAAPACLWLWRSARREGHADGEPSVRSAGGGADAAMRAGDGIRTLPCSRIADGPGAPTRGTPTRTTAGGEDHAHSILARGRLCRELPDYAGIRGSECCSAHGARR